MSKFKSTSNFESVNTYITSVDIEKTLVSLKGTAYDVNISMESLRANASSNEQGQSTQINSKTSIKSLEFSSEQVTFNMEKFNFDVALSGLDKKEYTNFTQLLSQNNTMMTTASTSALQTSAMTLLSKGIVLEIADFSLEEFSKNKDDSIKGFDIKSNFTFKEDKDLVQKMRLSPLMVIPNISVESEIRISKEMYTKLEKNNFILARLNGYEKEDGDDYIFSFKFIDAKASVNGKSLN
jgi:hypothetical protein